MKPKEIKKLSATLKAIADPTRRAIFELVWNSEQQHSISTVTKEFKMTRQGITKHLKILREGGLIELKRIGRVTYCNAQNDSLPRISSWMSHYETQTASELESTPTKANEILTSITEIEELAEDILEEVKREVSKAKEVEIAKPETAELPEEATEAAQTETEATEVAEAAEIEALEPEADELNEPKEEYTAQEITTEEQEEMEREKAELLQMSIDPNDPGTPVKIEPVAEEPINKEPKEKPIEVTENQLDIYGVRKEPKLDEEKQQFELF